MREIVNEELSIEMLPELGDRDSVFEFAMSFDGFAHYGSFERCAASAKSQARENLSDLRNELFFQARASRHRMDDRFLETYEELRPLIEAELNNAG